MVGSKDWEQAISATERAMVDAVKNGASPMGDEVAQLQVRLGELRDGLKASTANAAKMATETEAAAKGVAGAAESIRDAEKNAKDFGTGLGVVSAVTAGAMTAIKEFGFGLDEFGLKIARLTGDYIESLVSAFKALSEKNLVGVVSSTISAYIAVFRTLFEFINKGAEDAKKFEEAGRRSFGVSIPGGLEELGKAQDEAIAKAKKFREELSASFEESAKAASAGVAAIGEYLAGGLDFDAFRQKFTDGLRDAIIQSIQSTIISQAVVGRLAPLMAILQQELLAGRDTGAMAAIQVIGREAAALASKMEPRMAQFRDVLAGAFGGGPAGQQFGAMAPLPAGAQAGHPVQITITGNQIMSDQDVQAFGQKLIAALRGQGANLAMGV
jgi:hypothetical protein